MFGAGKWKDILPPQNVFPARSTPYLKKLLKACMLVFRQKGGE